MTEEQLNTVADTSEKDNEQSPLWENDVTLTPEHYANMAYVDETATDITMLFGSFFKEDSANSHQVCKARVVMSHHSFLAFADRITKEAQFLRRLYGAEGLTSIVDVDDAKWQAAFEEVYGTETDG